MVQNDLSKKFSKGTIAIHWLTAALILILFPVGKYMSGLPSIEKMGLIKIHALLGLTVLILTLIRCYLFFKSPRPEAIKTGSTFNDKLAVWIHNSFYFLLLAVSLSGVATMILGGYVDALQHGSPELIKEHSEIPPLEGHEVLATIIMILFVLHVIGVIKHYVLTQENTLKRIL